MVDQLTGPRRPAPPTVVDATPLWVDSRLRYELGLRVEGAALAAWVRTGPGAWTSERAAAASVRGSR